MTSGSGVDVTDSCPDELDRERYLAGTLEGARVEALERHLATCEACRGWLAEARSEEDLIDPLRDAWRDLSDEARQAAADPAELSPTALPRYRIGALIGTGGMGLVYEARQIQPSRRVALKLVRPGLTSERTLERFEFETEVLGRLNHPGIARIYEAGKLGDGSAARPFFSMELVEGRALTEYVLAEGLGLEERLGLFVRVCSAVQHAHQMGVVHRDLKPSNVLVTASGDPKILDFGVARIVGGDLTREALTTHAERFEGTLAYASPEQISGDAVETSSDVYALGVLFQELLTGERPFDHSGLSLDETVRAIREAAPRPLSASDPTLRGDLQTIASKALEKDPARRYPSVRAFAEDVRRYLSREPIAARPPSALYQLTRFSQRHRALVSGIAAVFAALTVGLVVNLMLKEEARRERDNVLRLSAFRSLRDLELRSERAWPVHGALEAEYVAWLSDAGAFIRGLYPRDEDGDPGHYAQRDAIRERAEEGAVSYRFEDAQDAWWHEQLDQLIGEIEAFADPSTGLVSGVSPRFGWGLERRLAWSRALEEVSLTAPDAAARWERARASIADPGECPAYRGLDLAPQLGLLPLGRDPDSGLWEFVHVLSGVPLDPGGGDETSFRAADGLVLVLIPGGEFDMGAQRDDPEGANHDPWALTGEGPVHRVTLSPFFLSKYEMTQGQWLRLSGSNPSVQGPRPGMSNGEDMLLHPVENVRWLECGTTLARFGLALPTEAQWEYAARAGTSTPWWCGADPAQLATAANLADQTCRRQSRSFSWVFEEWDDGFHQHAPVGSYRANAFGLHDVSGNVWEWCADALIGTGYAPGPAVDPWVEPHGTTSVHARGGAWNDPAPAVRMAIRNAAPQTYRGRTMGVRPARPLD